MKNSYKLYLFLSLLTILSFSGLSLDSNLYENQVASSVCEGDSNIIKAGCSVAVGQVVRVTPGIVTGVTFDKMGECFDKYGPTKTSTTLEARNTIVDLNDPCNQIATLNPKMDREKYAYIPYDPKTAISNSRPGIASLATILEVTSKEASNGVLLNREFALANSFKHVPYLKTSFAQSNTNSLNAITEFVFNFWQLSRNVAYLILLLGALFLGITIMIGNQAIDKDGKIKLTIEKAIPRVVIAVILISSSYYIGELILSSLVGGGIVQGFASFFAQAVLPQNTVSDWQTFLAYAGATLMMGLVAAFMAVTQGGLLIPILFGILAAVWKMLLINLYIVKNIIDLLIYIIFSPFYIVAGVLPSENKSMAFKKYIATLVKFVIHGFLLNLILFGSKAVLIFGLLEAFNLNSGNVIRQIADQYSSIANVIIYIFSLIAFVYILGLAKDSEKKAIELSQNITGTKPEKKSEDK